MAKKRKRIVKTTKERIKGYAKFIKGKEIDPNGMAMFEKALGKAVKK